MPLIKTTYTPEELAKVPAGKYEFIDEPTAHRLLDSDAPVRMYAFASVPGGRDQIVKVYRRTLDDLDLHAIWVSGNTLADLIKPASR